MIRGGVWKISDGLLPVVEFEIKQGDGEFRRIPALVDTGNDYDVVMSRTRILDLGLSFDEGETVGVRGVHGESKSPTCRTDAIWDGELRRVRIVEGNVPTLLGKGLLENFSIYIEMRDGGAIVLQRLPSRGVTEQP